MPTKTTAKMKELETELKTIEDGVARSNEKKAALVNKILVIIFIFNLHSFVVIIIIVCLGQAAFFRGRN